MEKTAHETIEQIKAIQKLFISTQEKIKKEAPKTYDKELIEILFEHPYCKTEILTSRLNISRITASKYLKQLESINVLKSKQVWKETHLNQTVNHVTYCQCGATRTLSQLLTFVGACPGKSLLSFED